MAIYCTICKHYGTQKAEDERHLERTNLYDEDDIIPIYLCRSHGVELFKNGQKSFLLKHHKILEEVIDSDSPDFLELLEKVYRENQHALY